MTIQLIVLVRNTKRMKFDTAVYQAAHTGKNSLTEFNLGVKISSLSKLLYNEWKEADF